MASVFKRGRWVDSRGKKCTKDAPGAKWAESRYWTVAVTQPNGRIRRVKGYTDKAASEQLGAKFERAKARGEQDMVDTYKPHRGRPLADHIEDYIGELRTLGRDDKYVYNVQKRLTKLRTLCGWKVLGDMTADAFCKWRDTPIKQHMAESEDGTIGPRTLNQYLEAVRGFCKWCVKRKRVPANPLADVQKIDEINDVRRVRRALTAEEVANLLLAVAEHHKCVYRFMLATGLRRQEIADLVWGDVHLDSPTLFLKLRPKATKSRRADALPLRADIAGELRGLRGEAADGERVFAAIPTMDEHRDYLTKAGINWKDSDGRRADVHALRHTYGTMLSKSGASPREAMELMRHTDLKLTMKVYTDPRIFDLSSAVERLPIPSANESAIVAVTGTDGKVDDGDGWRESATRASTEISIPSTGIGDADADSSDSQILEVDSLSRSAAGTGRNSAKMRHVGLEPTTR